MNLFIYSIVGRTLRGLSPGPLLVCSFSELFARNPSMAENDEKILVLKPFEFGPSLHHLYPPLLKIIIEFVDNNNIALISLAGTCTRIRRLVKEAFVWEKYDCTRNVRFVERSFETFAGIVNAEVSVRKFFKNVEKGETLLEFSVAFFEGKLEKRIPEQLRFTAINFFDGQLECCGMQIPRLLEAVKRQEGKRSEIPVCMKDGNEIYNISLDDGKIRSSDDNTVVANSFIDMLKKDCRIKQFPHH